MRTLTLSEIVYVAEDWLVASTLYVESSMVHGNFMTLFTMPSDVTLGGGTPCQESANPRAIGSAQKWKQAWLMVGEQL